MKTKLIIIIFAFLILIFNFNSYSQFHQEWVNRLPSANVYSFSPTVLSDKSGNSYLLNVIDDDTTSNTHNVIKLTKFLPNGSTSWTATYSYSPSSSQVPITMKMTTNTDIFILGTASQNNSNFLVVKYNSAGVLQWSVQYDSAYDTPTGFTLDNNGYFYVSGISGFKPTLVKINPSGNILWHRSISGNYAAYQTGGVVADDNTDIYMQYGYVDFETAIARLVKYNSSGNLMWDSLISYSGMGLYIFKGLQKNNANKIYYAFINGSAMFASYPYLSIVKLETNGSRICSYNYYGGSSFSKVDIGNFIVTDDGSVITGGSVLETPFLKYKMLLLKYNSTGTLISSKKISYNSSYDTYGNYTVIDKYLSIYVCGSAYVSESNIDFLSVKFNLTTDSLNSILYNGPPNLNDGISCAAIDKNNNLFVTGQSYNSSNNLSAAIIKYSQLVGIINNNGNVPKRFSLSQNYPNPFNPVTKISFSIPLLRGLPAQAGVDGAAGRGVFTELVIYNIQGKEITTLVNQQLQAGIYEVDWNASDYPSGVYFYKLEFRQAGSSTGNYSETKRMVLIK